MTYEAIVALAGAQHNRVARRQLETMGFSKGAIEHAVESGRLVAVENGVYAMPPVLPDPWGRWTAATLTEPGTYVALWSATVAFGWLKREKRWVTAMRDGSSGPRRLGDVVVYYRPLTAAEVGEIRGVPVTAPERTLLDVAQYAAPPVLARALRQAVRLGHTSIGRCVEYVAHHPRRRGARKLRLALARHSGLPIERARSGSEVAALIVLREHGLPVPELNVPIAGLEADLVWRDRHLIVEVDGGPFHLDVGEDARKEAAWRAAGWTVRRVSSDDVHRRPDRLLAAVR